MRKRNYLAISAIILGGLFWGGNELEISHASETAQQTSGWKHDNKGWWYANVNGTYQTDKWFQDKDGSWYHFDPSGYMQTGWFQDKDQEWYYLDNNSGKMRTGFFTDTDGKQYYFLESGKMAIQNVKEYIENEYGEKIIYTYYIDENGIIYSIYTQKMSDNYVETATNMIIVDNTIKDSDVKDGKIRKVVKTQEQEYKINSSDNFLSISKSTYGSCVRSNLFPQRDGTFVRVQKATISSELEYADRALIVETYTEDFKRINYKLIDQELPIFGGVYATEDNYFVISGQRNPDESDLCEVIRVIKYDKNWNRIDSASIYGANTTVPFNYGSVRCVEQDDTLYIRTCHTMYTSEDGLNHQANMSFEVDISSMEVLEDTMYTEYEVFNISTGYVSHSFDQYITSDDGKIVTLDQGDAYPRAAVLVCYDLEAEFSGSSKYYRDDINNVETIQYAGRVGDNQTNAKIGGLAVSDTSYITAGLSTDQTGNTSVQNVYITVTDKDDFSESDTKLIWITNYTKENQYDTSIMKPYLIKINDNSFILLWNNPDNGVDYVMLDRNGRRVGNIQNIEAELSECTPVVSNGKLVWYSYNKDRITFYQLDIQ